MKDNYYSSLGSVLKDALTSEENPFDISYSQTAKCRTIGGRTERRPPSKITVEKKRIAVPSELLEDFAILNVLPGVPLEDCKRAWKILLKKYHPDTINNKNKQSDPNAVIRRVNNSYKKIEYWFKTGKILDSDNFN